MRENRDKAIRTTWVSIAGNGLLAIAKGLTGYFGNSYALIADAIESTTDVFASFVVLFGIRYATKPADENHPYGHGKAEPLITFAVVAFLVVSAFIIAYKSIVHIQAPHKMPESYTLYVLAAIILIKEFFYRFVSSTGRKIKSTALKADAWHHRSDAITSLMAFIGISAALYLGEGYEMADDIAALLASGFIVYNAWLIFRPALSEIMDEDVYEDMTREIRKISSGVEGVSGTEKCFIRKSGLTFHVDLHMIVDGNIPVRTGHSIAHQLKDEIQKKLPQISDVLIHIEPDVYSINPENHQ